MNEWINKLLQFIKFPFYVFLYLSVTRSLAYIGR